MVGAAPKFRLAASPASRSGRRICSWSFVVQQNLMSPGPMLAALPTSFNPQAFFGQGGQQGHQQQQEPDAASMYRIATEMFQNACERLNCASDKLGMAAECMREMTTVIMARETAAQARANQNIRNDLELCLGTNCVQERQSDAPAVSDAQNLYDKPRRTVKQFATWFLENATGADLRGSWIQFTDSPRCAVDGLYLRDFLSRELDLAEPMSFAIERLLKWKKLTDVEGCSHYVLHDWAAKALEVGATAEDCVVLFDRQKRSYKLPECTKIVPFILLGDQYVSLSIDLGQRSTMLIHPTQSSRPTHDVLDQFRPMCQHLTCMALSNMAFLSNKQIDSANWSFGVALQQEHPMERNNAGVVTYYYSIPKDNQFMIVSDTTIENAKQTFVHELVKQCKKFTKKKLQKGYKKEKTSMKRRADGKFAKQMNTGDSSHGSAEGSRAPSMAAAIE